MKSRLARLASLALLLPFSLTAGAVVINEIQPNPPGSDPANQSIELLGTPLSAFSGVLLSIESDSGNVGKVDRLAAISGTFDANGLLLTTITDLENPSFTLVLLDSFSGALGTDIDADNDGSADDLSSFGSVLDAIGVPDALADETTLYGAQLGGQDFRYTGDEPGLIFRDRVTQAWYAINNPAGSAALDIAGNSLVFSSFDRDPTNHSFGSANPTRASVPTPGTPLLFGLGVGLLGIYRRRQRRGEVEA